MSLVFDPQIIGAAGPQSHNLDDCVWQSPALRAIICRIVVAVIMQSAHLKTGQGESLFQFPDTTSCLAANLQFSENPQNRPAASIDEWASCFHFAGCQTPANQLTAPVPERRVPERRVPERRVPKLTHRTALCNHSSPDQSWLLRQLFDESSRTV